MPKANIYTYHWDYPNEQWNVYDPEDNYVKPYKKLEDARSYCDEENKKLHAKEKEKYAIQE